MKNLLLLIILSFAISICSAEEKSNNQFHIELNGVHFSKAYGVFLPSFYNNQLSYLKGVDLSLTQSQKTNYYLGFKNQNYTIALSSFLYNGESKVSGFEINAGIAKILSDKAYNFTLGIAFEWFLNRTKHAGFYILNEPNIIIQNNNILLGPTNFNVVNNYYEYSVNHNLTYTGPAIKVKAFFNLIPQLDVVLDFRFKLGVVFVDGIEIPDFEYKPNLMLLLDPINVFGLRYNFHL